MRYFFKRLSLNDNEVVYAYGRETKITTGEISYNRLTKKLNITKPSKEDSDDNGQYTFRRIFAHLYNRFQENLFDEDYMIAFG